MEHVMPFNISKDNFPISQLTIADCEPSNGLEALILKQAPEIEDWFQKRWQTMPAMLTCSVDLRNAGFKIAPVDTNLFPAGFNNLNTAFVPLCVQAMQSTLSQLIKIGSNVLLIPESHTRNPYYLQSLSVLRSILIKAGFNVRIGSLDSELNTAMSVSTIEGDELTLEPITRSADTLSLVNFKPDVIVLNNDLSAAVPDILKNISQKIIPEPALGWSTRLKSDHFSHYDTIASEFASFLDIDPWFINPIFASLSGLDFMAQEGIDALALLVHEQLEKIEAQYKRYDIKHKPFVVVKSDNGTYGMSVMTVRDAEEIREINRKQRTKMSVGKARRKVERVIIQEGVYTFETMADGAVAEPVIYMIGAHVVGGFYRVHQGRGVDENLNAPGMHFVPLAFSNTRDMSDLALHAFESPNRFYVYGVIARLAALAAAEEAKSLREWI